MPPCAMSSHACLLALAATPWLFATASAGTPWDDVTTILDIGVKTRVFPGAVALVGDRTGILYEHAVGSLTYVDAWRYARATVPP